MEDCAMWVESWYIVIKQRIVYAITHVQGTEEFGVWQDMSSLPSICIPSRRLINSCLFGTGIIENAGMRIRILTHQRLMELLPFLCVHEIGGSLILVSTLGVTFSQSLKIYISAMALHVLQLI